ncbi:class I SAM-dependent methyltransferase [Halothiobacillus sp. DCM-1]|uniref:class I SAM-dependent methyltransferase n=1 Tax=Halothiobacillus sp. DCM-1 TaxID=3112558 RepID=UPI0032533C2D
MALTPPIADPQTDDAHPAPRHEQAIRQSWARNAAVWAEVVRADAIASRREVTNAAILQVLRRYAPRRLLDIGCGEGWLMRQMNLHGATCVGIDAEPTLISAACGAGGGEFAVCDYAGLADWARRTGRAPFDVCVCNFSLIGAQSTEAVFAAAQHLLVPGGRLVVQTLHPGAVGGSEDYVSGWRAGSWSGFDARFTEPAPWYFRTLSDWFALFVRHGFCLEVLQEPVDPSTRRPVSLILAGVRVEPASAHAGSAPVD